MWKKFGSIKILLIMMMLFATEIANGSPLPHHQLKDMQEVFIQLQGQTITDIESTIRVIEGVSGRVLHTYPPNVIIATVPPDQIDELLENSNIQSIDTDEISAERLKNTQDEIRLAAAAWNEHIKAERNAVSKDNSSEGLLWDHPNYLPPDPPPDVQQLLRHHEREMESGQDSN
ncbi:MAG TPA: hypothetical protein V6C91_18600 [Coleofasciculaceae cyanobacterium]